MKLDFQGQGGGRILDVDVGGLENWTVFMYVICVSSLNYKKVIYDWNIKIISLIT